MNIFHGIRSYSPLIVKIFHGIRSYSPLIVKFNSLFLTSFHRDWRMQWDSFYKGDNQWISSLTSLIFNYVNSFIVKYEKLQWMTKDGKCYECSNLYYWKQCFFFFLLNLKSFFLIKNDCYFALTWWNCFTYVTIPYYLTFIFKFSFEIKESSLSDTGCCITSL